MLFLFGGLAILGGLLALVYLFVNADPVRLARNLKWTGISVAVVAAVGLVLVPPVRELAVLLFPLAMSMPLLSRLRGVLDRYRAPSTGQTAGVETDFLRMTLDQDTGSVSGTVLRGRFVGLRLEELGLADLLALLRECRAEDEKSARLLEAYLDRVHPEWRDELAGGRGGSSSSGTGPAGGDISVDEAYAVLGLAPGATPGQIKEAHRRLMIKLHPDHGGSDYLAAKINRARDILLRRR
ncbi:MAG TPA: DnaJ domain-containing protein [Stellaceae bacterium]|jgi:hypothetical protein